MIHLLWTIPALAVLPAQVAFVEARRFYRSVSDSCAGFQRVNSIYPPYRHDP